MYKSIYVICLVFVDLSLGEVCEKPELDVCSIALSPAANQLVNFRASRKGPVGALTTSTGRLVEKDTASEVINDDLIFNDRFIEGLSSLVQEPTLPRVVHAQGSGAEGYFKVTHDVSDITNIGIFNGIGKKTQVVVRFSSGAPDSGSSDLIRDIHAVGMKFKTPEGNLDLLGLSSPTFIIKDTGKFPSFVHAFKRNPQTHTQDENMRWDFITLNKESIFFVLHLFSDISVPCSYTNVPSYPIHTFVLCNSKGKRFFGRFRIEPDNGLKGLTPEEAELLAAKDPDYLNRDLFDRIARGEYPSWTVSIQALSEEDAKKAKINIWDVTVDLDRSIYVPRTIGKVYLNKNPENFNRDVDSLGFSVSNMVPGIEGVDPMFKARRIFYLEALNQRLGVNHHEIPINRPLVPTYTYYRDGVPPLGSNGNNAPNYYPNSFFGPASVATPQCPKFTKQIVINPKPTNFDQAADYFHGLEKDEQNRLVENIVSSLLRVTATFLRKKAIEFLKEVDSELGSKVQVGLEKNLCELKNPQKQEHKIEKEVKVINKSEDNYKEKEIRKQDKEARGGKILSFFLSTNEKRKK